MSQRNNPCEFCDTDQPQELQRVTVTRQRGGQWYIFEDVPVWVTRAKTQTPRPES
jgi:hypothetical protein